YLMLRCKKSVWATGPPLLRAHFFRGNRTSYGGSAVANRGEFRLESLEEIDLRKWSLFLWSPGSNKNHPKTVVVAADAGRKVVAVGSAAVHPKVEPGAATQ